MNKYTLNILALLSVTTLIQPAISAIDKSPDIVRQGAITNDKKGTTDALIANEKGEQDAKAAKDPKALEKEEPQNPAKADEIKETAGAGDKTKAGSAEDALSEYPGMIAAEKDPKVKAELEKEYKEEKALLEEKPSNEKASEAGDLGDDADLNKFLEKEEKAMDKENKTEADFNAELEKDLDKDIKSQDPFDKKDPDLKDHDPQGAGAAGGGGSADY